MKQRLAGDSQLILQNNIGSWSEHKHATCSTAHGFYEHQLTATRSASYESICFDSRINVSLDSHSVSFLGATPKPKLMVPLQLVSHTKGSRGIWWHNCWVTLTSHYWLQKYYKSGRLQTVQKVRKYRNFKVCIRIRAIKKKLKTISGFIFISHIWYKALLTF